MNAAFFLGVLLAKTMSCHCQSSTLIVKVIEQDRVNNITLVCAIPSSTNSTRWTYLSGSTGTSLMIYQNGQCAVSLPDSFLSKSSMYKYTCNSTMYQVTMIYSPATSIDNHIVTCQDAHQLDVTGSAWIIKYPKAIPCSYCESTITFNVMDVTERGNAKLICKISADVAFVNWNRLQGNESTTVAMGFNQSGICNTQGSTFMDDTTKYTFTCNQTVYQVTRLNVHRSEHNVMYMCTPTSQLVGKGSNWILKVQAPVTSVTLTPANSSVNVTENIPVNFTCITSTARPAATVYWYIHSIGNSNDRTRITNNITSTTDYNDLSITKSILRLVPTRQDNNMKIFCEANNLVNTIPVPSNNKRLLNVLYEADHPYILQGNRYRVVENTPATLSCTAKGGNPRPTLSWSCNNFSPRNQTSTKFNENVTTTVSWTPSRSHEGICTCVSKQTEFPTKTVNVSLIVLSLPTVKGCAFHYNIQSNVVNLSIINNNIKVIEKETITLKCTAEGKPSPKVWWKTPQRSFVSSSTVTVKNLTREMKGNYVFTANSLLEPSFKEKQNVTVNKTISVQVFYPPVVYSMNDVSKQNGTLLNMVCNYTAGKPETTTVKWTRDIDETKWNTATLNIESLENSDTGIYTCTASNIMKQSGDDKSYIGQHNQSFHLDVQYAASISSFTINGLKSKNVTVNESNSVILTCTGDSNPPAMMTPSDKKETLKTVLSNNVKYNIPQASCHDAGIYYCSAINIHNNGSEVQNVVQLFVNCLPRVGDDIDVNVTSEKNRTVTIVFNGIAYPPPTFSWYQLDDGDWTLLHKGDNYVIQSADSQSNLTIHSVSMNNFTNYKVIVENKFGQMEQVYTLSPYDKPDPPTSLRHIVGITTASSIHIEWKPGFDNGPSQTFYIKYKKSSDTVWNYLSVSDNGEPTMNITLTGLLENTQYDVIIFASNVKGNSTESNVLITRTKAIQNPTSIPGALIGGIAGGVTGCIVIVIVIVFIVRRYPLFKENGADRQNVRRSVSDDSDDEDGLVDNPMYASSSNVAPVASTSASTSTDIYSKPVKPNKTNAAGNGDIYSVVNKTKGQGKGGKCKSTNEKGKRKEGDVYENVELENNPNKKDAGKQLPPKPPAEQPKLKIVNQDGLIYADLIFKDKPPGEKMVILGDDPTPYDLVDFTKKADPLPESDEEEQK